ncbi:hypothetical protein [Corynebacterium comes]|uniref:Uncharacterized protein n=1 Tax=Corynebacterium comes TaxID=2675218 RepID=A0A6B8VXK5_9CORY|nr:hypothetical protein [Corynebacterium comes]QGU03725.1 hypothetical protein CETAM_02225 [Corynebacterium comes]
MRIPGVLDAVRRAWEGQPELSLPTLFGILANQGVGWGASDEDLLRALSTTERTHPGTLPLVDARVTSRYLLLTESPEHRVMVDPWRVIVRRPGVSAQPGVWDYATIRPAFVGSPLVITSAEGIDHRLGVLARISLLDASPDPGIADLTGIRRRDLGDAVYLVTLRDGDTVVLSHGFDRFTAGRRSLDHEARPWDSLVACSPGQPLVVRSPGGGRALEYAEVRDILLLEDEPLSE